MDNNEVFALFEDIKNGLKGINDRLENVPKVSNGQSGEQASTMDLASIKDLFDSSAKEHQEQTKAMLTEVRGGGGLRIEQDSALVTKLEGIVCPKFGRTEG